MFKEEFEIKFNNIMDRTQVYVHIYFYFSPKLTFVSAYF